MSSERSVHCLVITPEKTVVDERVDAVIVPLYDGEFGIYPDRAPVVGRLGHGELRLYAGALVKRLYVDGGFVQVKANQVSVLTPTAAAPEELNEDEVQQRLQQYVRMVPRTPEEEAEREREINRAVGQLLVIHRAAAAR